LRRTIAARSGLIQLSPRDGALLLTLFDGEIQEINLEKIEEFRRLIFSKHLMSISVDDMFLQRSESELRNDREKSTQRMWQEVQASRAEMAMLAQQPNFEEQLEEMQHYERTIKSLLVEIHKKYAIPIASIVFILIGAPLGVLARRGGFATGVGLSLGFFLFYWALFIGGEDLADRQMVSPFLAMWSANFITGALGVYVFWYVAIGNLAPASLTFKDLFGRLFFREFFLRNIKIRRSQGGVDSNQDLPKRQPAEAEIKNKFVDLPGPQLTAPTVLTSATTTLTTPRFDLPPVLEILRHLVHRTHADFALLCDRNGVPLAHYGNLTTVETANGEMQFPSIADFDKIAVLAAKQIAATQEIARSIGEDGRFNSIFHEGECRNNCIHQIGDNFILINLVEKTVALGLVRVHANQAVASLQKVL
jgi:predicted regulator of Ras-like GTPase activity (Roadblock/LC7/MglB family)